MFCLSDFLTTKTYLPAKTFLSLTKLFLGGTPLHYASSAGTVGLLLANGADPTMRMLDPPMSGDYSKNTLLFKLSIFMFDNP